MAALDLDFSGAIDRMEWIEYNVECDQHTGKMVPSKGTSTFFRKIDASYQNNRTVLSNKLRQQITEQATKAIQFAFDSSMEDADRIIMQSVIKDVAIEVVSELDPHNHGVIKMADVIAFQHQIDFKVKKLVDYSVEIVKCEIKEHQLKHQVTLDFQEMEGNGGDAMMRNKAKHHHKRR